MPAAPLAAIHGAAQITQRADDPREALSPLSLIEKTLRRAAEDAGSPALLEKLDAVIVPQSIWAFTAGTAPAKQLAERIGAPSAVAGSAVISGTSILEAVDWACTEIAAGRRRLVAIAAGECERSKRRAESQGVDLGWEKLEPELGKPILGGDRPEAMLGLELEIGVRGAPHGFALCETALRRARGESPAEHRLRIAGIWEQLSRVATTNPDAWIQRAVSAREIHDVSESNRVVAWPYTKLMSANMVVDQASAVIIGSCDDAEALGIDVRRSLYPHTNTLSAHVVPLSERAELHEHAGQQLATERALEVTGLAPSDLSAIDLYSCFPFAVQTGAAALGIAPETGEPPLSVTGGLTFSGGPLNNYVLQAMAATVRRMREQPGHALLTAVGGYFAKFAACVLSNEVPAEGRKSVDLTNEVAKILPTRPVLESTSDPVEVESFTGIQGRDGDRHLIFTTRTEDGARAWARSEDSALFDAIIANEELCGLRGRIDEARTLHLD